MKILTLTVMAVTSLALTTASCSSGAPEAVLSIDIASRVDPSMVSVPDDFADIELALAPVLTDSTMLSGNANISAIINGIYFVNGTKMMTFGSDGECIASFDRKGNGPGEYSEFDRMTADPSTSDWMVFTSSSNTALRYTMTGNFVSCDTLPGNCTSPFPLSDGHWIAMNNGLDDKRIKFYYLDRELKTIDSLVTPLNHCIFTYYGSTGSFSPSVEVHGREAIFVWNDTIWDVSSPKAGCRPIAALDLGNYAAPADLNPFSDSQRYKKEFIAPNISFTDRHFMVYFIHDGRTYAQFYNRADGSPVALLISSDEKGRPAGVPFPYGDGEIYLIPTYFATADSFYFMAHDSVMADITGDEDANPAFFSITIR